MTHLSDAQNVLLVNETGDRLDADPLLYDVALDIAESLGGTLHVLNFTPVRRSLYIRAKERGIPFTPSVMLDAKDRFEATSSYIDRESIGLVVVAAATTLYTKHVGTGLSEKLFTRTRVPVVTVPDLPCRATRAVGDATGGAETTGSPIAVHNLVVINNGLGFDRTVVGHAFDIAELTGATVQFLYVELAGGYSRRTMGPVDRTVPLDEFTDERYAQLIRSITDKRANQVASAAFSMAHERGIDVELHTAVGDTSLDDSIASSIARFDVDLVLLGAYGLRSLSKLGITVHPGETLTERLVKRTDRPVLTVNVTPARTTSDEHIEDVDTSAESL